MADKTSQRPTAVILQDFYAGFRDSFSGEVDGEPVWLPWDYALANALQIIEDHTDSETGHLIWVEQSERVTFDASKFTKKSVAAVERKTKSSKSKAYEAAPGERWRTVPRTTDGGPLPTMLEWRDEQARKR